jgi:hypothetical protein
MGKGDAFWTAQRKRSALKTAEASGVVADSMEVRMALIERMNKGELTLAEVQAELARIKRGAKAAGMTTRNRAFSDG